MWESSPVTYSVLVSYMVFKKKNKNMSNMKDTKVVLVCAHCTPSTVLSTLKILFQSQERYCYCPIIHLWKLRPWKFNRWPRIVQLVHDGTWISRQAFWVERLDSTTWVHCLPTFTYAPALSFDLERLWFYLGNAWFCLLFKISSFTISFFPCN